MNDVCGLQSQNQKQIIVWLKCVLAFRAQCISVYSQGITIRQVDMHLSPES